MKISFEWGAELLANPDFSEVYERLAGSDYLNTYVMPTGVVESFIRARRDFVYRTVTTQAQAMLIFSPTIPTIN